MMNLTPILYLHIDAHPLWPTCLYDEVELSDAGFSTAEERNGASRSSQNEAAPASAPGDVEARTSIAMADLWTRSIRERHLADFHISDPVWGILLDIYVAESKGQKTSLSSLGYAALAPRSTGMRWVNVLINEGKLMSEPDPVDRRRRWVRLSRSTRTALDNYFAELTCSPRYRLHIGAIALCNMSHSEVSN